MFATKLIIGRSRLVRGFYVTRLNLNNVTGTPVELDIVNKIKQTGAQSAKALPKDYSLLKLGAWIVVLGSMLTNVIDKKQQFEEMEAKYNLKIEILKGVITRLRNGEEVDVNDELRLVNKTFERRNIPRYQSPFKRKKSQLRNDMTDIVQVEEESLENIWKDILKEASEVELKKVNISAKLSDSSVSSLTKDDIVRDRKVLQVTSEQEKEELKYYTPTNKHIIVTTPGEVIEAAKDTKMTKYL